MSLKAVLLNLGFLAAPEDPAISFEVVVVIDGSTDNTVDMLAELNVPYTLRYFYIDNSGLSAARNFGIDQCEGAYVITCDDDVLLHPEYLIKLSASVSRFPENVHIGNLVNIDKAYTSQIIDGLLAGEPQNQDRFADLSSYHVFFEAAKQLFFYQSDDAGLNTAVWWAVVTGGNLCIPKKHFTSFGKFDPNIKGWGPEDADLCYRFFCGGVNASYNRDCLLYHLDHDRDPSKITETMTKNAVYFIKKYKKPAELYDYLNFTNGKLSLLEFNNKCCDRFGKSPVNIPPFAMSMKDYSGKEQLLKYDQ